MGTVHVAVFPRLAGPFARFLLYRTNGTATAHVLIGSGSSHDTQSCIAQATSAAQRAEAIL